MVSIHQKNYLCDEKLDHSLSRKKFDNLRETVLNINEPQYKIGTIPASLAATFGKGSFSDFFKIVSSKCRINVDVRVEKRPTLSLNVKNCTRKLNAEFSSKYSCTHRKRFWQV